MESFENAVKNTNRVEVIKKLKREVARSHNKVFNDFFCDSKKDLAQLHKRTLISNNPKDNFS